MNSSSLLASSCLQSTVSRNVVLKTRCLPGVRSFMGGKVHSAATPTLQFGSMSRAYRSYNPWSRSFRGTNRRAVVLQSMVYGACLAAVIVLARPEKKFPQEAIDKATREAQGILDQLAAANKVLAERTREYNKAAKALLAAKGAASQSSYASEKELQEAIAALKSAFPDKGYIRTDLRALQKSGASYTSYLPDIAHTVIVRPLSTDDVVKVIHISRQFRVPVIASGGATSFEGQFTGHPQGSICLDMSRMNKVIKINAEDGDLVCQAGAKWEHINTVLKDKGIALFFPLDPGPGATIGGMINTGCSGVNSIRYGSARAEWFLNITVVLPNGDVIKTRQRARNSATGFDSTKLFIGAEGTLGIVTEATLRLAPVVPHRVAIAQFTNIKQAASAVQEMLASSYGSQIQCVELLDHQLMQAISESGIMADPQPVEDTVLLKIQGDPATIEATSAAIKTISEKYSTSMFKLSETEEESEELWRNRKHTLLSTMMSDPEAQCWMTDVCVPVSKLPALVQETKDDIKSKGLNSTIWGHIGSGNFHALILFNGEQEFKLANQIVHRMAKRAIALDGSCTGEHGIGVAKKQYLDDELGHGTVELMRTIKRALDPLHLLNPGKLYPDESVVAKTEPEKAPKIEVLVEKDLEAFSDVSEATAQ